MSGAQVAVVNRTGVISRQNTNDTGEYSLSIPEEVSWKADLQIEATAPGFALERVAPDTPEIRLRLAPQSNSVSVAGSAIERPLLEQGGSASVIDTLQIRDRNEALIPDLLRQVPGVVIAQSGPGSVASLFVRGGDSKYNLVLLNGIPVSSFYYGGLFDFAHIPSDAVAEIDVARGPQSAVYGSYAIASVVNLVTRSPENGPALDVVAEGGSHAENRFALSGSGTLHGWGLAGSLNHIYDGGPVSNSDYTNQGVFLGVSRKWNRQNLFAFGDYDWNEVGEPGAYGSNPKGYFSGLDLVSRSRNHFSTYGAHYQADVTPRFRQDVFAGFFSNVSRYTSSYGTSFNKDLRANGEVRETFSVTRHWVMAAGFSLEREEVRNTYIASTGGSILLRRDNEGIYWENRWEFRNRLFVNAGIRGELFQTPFVPGNASGYPPRPDFPARGYHQASPKLSGVYVLTASTRAHASMGTGIRPPGGSDLAFTNNPALLPERSVSYDLGLEQSLFRDRLSLNATWFHSDFRDLIVSLGGSLARLSLYSTDNLNNARTEGVENTAQWRPSSWLFIRGSYTWLQAQIEALKGTGLAQQYYTVGEPLPRRPRHSGSMLATIHYRRLDATVAGYFRGTTLDVEPTYGAFGGLFQNPGYQNIALNVNWGVKGNLTAYANVHNLLNQRYEEVYGFPALKTTVVAGLKWSLARAR